MIAAIVDVIALKVCGLGAACASVLSDMHAPITIAFKGHGPPRGPVRGQGLSPVSPVDTPRHLLLGLVTEAFDHLLDLVGIEAGELDVVGDHDRRLNQAASFEARNQFSILISCQINDVKINAGSLKPSLEDATRWANGRSIECDNSQGAPN